MRYVTPRSLRGKTIAVIGCGQIGGSMIKRLSMARPKVCLLAHDRDRRLSASVSRYAGWVTDFAEIVRRADIIIIATPVPSIVKALGQIAEILDVGKPKALVLDTGTVRTVVDAAASKFKTRFDHAGVHPLAGAQGEGWESSRADLFEGRTVIITSASKSRLTVVRALVNALGATALMMQAKMHDHYAAEAIGLPHLLAYAAQGMSLKNPLNAGSWGSLTRVAASNPEMVAGFLALNAAEQRNAVARFERELRLLKSALNDRTGKSLLKLLTQRQRME